MFIPKNRSIELYSDLILQYINDKEGKGKIFLDTNVLIWALNINKSAFEEFKTILNKLEISRKLVIPNWVIFEFDQFVRSKNKSNIQQNTIPKSLKKNLADFQDYVDFTVDDSIAKAINYESKAVLKEELLQAKQKIEKITSIVNVKRKEEKKSRISYFTDLVRNNNSNVTLESIIKEANIQSEFRYKNRIPPGFRDISKPTNKEGDLILWFEIIKYCEQNNNAISIFLTNDNKDDWIAKYPTDNDENYIDAHPYLKHEYQSRIEKGEFYLINLNFLIDSIFSSKNFLLAYEFTEFKNLSEAVGVELGKSNTDKMIEWIIRNPTLHNEMSKTVCSWQFSPDEIDVEDMEKWIRERYSGKIKLDKVNWFEIIVSLYL